MASQVLTLVFTDVVGSSAAKRDADLGTSVSVRDRAYLEAIQSKHIRVVRNAVAEHKGTEIMTIGDSFFLTFAEPLDALRCSAAIQQRLMDQPIDTLHGPLRLRIGIHVGTPEFFEGSWHGTDVDIAARTQSVASARQIVVTHAARQIMGDPAGIKFRPLGTFALKGVGNVKLWDADYDFHGLRAAAVKSNECARRDRAITWAVYVFIALLVIVASSWFGGKNPAPVAPAAVKKPVAISNINSIIVANFENKTGDPVFDGMLTEAFTIQLRQSPVFTIVSNEHLRQSMQYLGKSPDDPVTPAIAREIGIREGIKAYISGSITKLGEAYVLNVTAVNTASGDIIASQETQAAGRDHILDALGTIATSLRTQLGESLDSIQKLDTPLSQATTPSLDAFRAYALGYAEVYKGRAIPEGAGHYKEALEIDPKFAMAWLGLGVAYFNGGQSGKAIECFRKAHEVVGKVSARERFHIDAFYHQYVTGDVRKSIDVLTLACQTYPLETAYYVDLANAQNTVGLLDASMENYRKALALSPDSAIPMSSNLYGLETLDRYDEARQVAELLKKSGMTDTSDTNNLLNLHTLVGDTTAMAQDAATTQGRDDDYNLQNTLSNDYDFMGKYAESERSWHRGEVEASVQKAHDAQADFILNRLTDRGIAGLSVDAGADIKAALAVDSSKPTLIWAVFAAALANLPDVAQPIMANLAHEYPDDTVVNQINMPIWRALLALNAHEPQQALKELEGTEQCDHVSLTGYVRGLAYLELKDGPNAVEAFRNATRYRGAVLLSFYEYYGQAQLGLARAYTLTGDKDNARKTYEALFATWKDADADLPQLLAAKKEYAELK